MNTYEIKVRILSRLELLKAEKDGYLQYYKNACNEFDSENITKYYRWWRCTCERIEELEMMYDFIMKGEEDGKN